uniref:Transcriptional regulator, Middle operon regulator (Mor) family n=1 Tax=Candidatus Kentrum sp. LPFa TaxID=2126335 RepID=A0A450WDE4_9GAMM|nr:MAG: Transcriptional regulator, Middle operon regulator (Mor) family [Candidatus Kentron sp. LPFa]
MKWNDRDSPNMPTTGQNDANRKPGEELLADLGRQVAEALVETLKIDKTLSDHVGNEVILRMVHHWGGQNFYLPKKPNIEIHQRDLAIWRAFTGNNQQQLAREYNISLPWIYKILRRMRKGPTGRQPPRANARKPKRRPSMRRRPQTPKYLQGELFP